MGDHRSYCPLNLALEVFGDRWTLLVVRDIMSKGKRHFREILGSEEKISSNILSDRLSMLEAEGIITKKPDPSHKQKVIYSLTQRGIDLFPVLLAMNNWSLKYKPVEQEGVDKMGVLNEGGPRLIEQIMEQMKLDHL